MALDPMPTGPRGAGAPPAHPAAPPVVAGRIICHQPPHSGVKQDEVRLWCVRKALAHGGAATRGGHRSDWGRNYRRIFFNENQSDVIFRLVVSRNWKSNTPHLRYMPAGSLQAVFGQYSELVSLLNGCLLKT